ncbi:MAG: D-2-hydroxyacid dehydrogenase, partial [Rhodopila sp.]|nr:D-2-hydroxyacid dehydrogenase [Rhodopila sp.]
MRNTPSLLLWTDSPGPYIDAIRAAGLSDRVSIDPLGRKDKPSATQLAQTQVLLAAGVPFGLLPTMPNLRWAQSLTAGVEGWLALPDLPPALTLTCARGTHRESMPENILAALFH